VKLNQESLKQAKIVEEGSEGSQLTRHAHADKKKKEKIF